MPKRRPKRKLTLPAKSPVVVASVARRKRPKKKAKVSRRKQNASSLGGTGNKRKKSCTRPTTLQDETGQDVWIATATLADINKTRRSKKPPFIKNRQYLYNIPAAHQRNECYERAAAAWQDMEQSLLPKYGNRPWQVVVRISDPTTTTTTNSSSNKNKNNKTPYFVFGQRTGLLELAAWPHLLLKIPTPPRFPGYFQKVKKMSSPEQEPAGKKRPAKKELQQEDEEEEDAHEADREEETSDAEEEEEEDDSDAEEKEEEQVQVQNEEENEGGVDADEEQSREEEEQSHEEEEELGSGDEEETVDDDDDEGEEEEKEESEDEEDDDDLLDEEIADLQERCVTPLSTLAWELRMQVPLPHVSIKWISPLLESYTSRTSAWDRAMQLARQEVFLDRTLLGVDSATGKQVPIQSSNNNNKKKSDKTSNKSTVRSSVISKNLALKAGKLRFERDGLWVIGQEEEWQQERWKEKLTEETTTTNTAVEVKENNNKETAASSNNKNIGVNGGGGGGDGAACSSKRNLTGLAMYLQCHCKTHQAKRLQQMTAAVASTGQQVQLTLRQAEMELRSMWKTSLAEDERLEWGRRAAAAVAASSTAAAVVEETSGMVPPTNKEAEEEEEEDCRKMPVVAQTTSASAAEPMTSSSAAVCVTPTTSEAPEKSTTAGVSGLDSSARRRLVVALEEPSMAPSAASAASASVNVEAMPRLPPPSPITNEDAESGSLFVPSTYWRLNREQIQLCYNAGIEHYETIMATVKARDLSRELQDGFDLLRERGRGRFDMELPVFDTPAFRFLTDLKKAPWMPVVRQILGKDVALIHKGMFLSLPGAETQEYHQDGVHLNTQYQKPCHAINVFIPLIDLTLKSGPTEFCIGSHFLGQEEYSRDFLETPLVKSGTPVIFDYRLGHKGLCNQSNECRPIVYCTYAPAAGGSEFRDSVNFSRKRYHRIGDLVRQGPTREERARKRKLLAEEQVEQERVEDNTAKSTSKRARPESTSGRNSKRRQQPPSSNGESSSVDFV